MKDRKGNFVITVDGVDYGFRFSTWAIGQAGKECGFTTVSAFWHSIAGEEFDSIISLIKHAHNEYNYAHKIEGEVDSRDISNIIDEMGGLINAISLITDGLKQFDPNQTAPETGHPEEQITH